MFASTKLHVLKTAAWPKRVGSSLRKYSIIAGNVQQSAKMATLVLKECQKTLLQKLKEKTGSRWKNGLRLCNTCTRLLTSLRMWSAGTGYLWRSRRSASWLASAHELLMHRGPPRVGSGTRKAVCSVDVVYEIPLSCGRVYIGQTGRCTNDRIAEHELPQKLEAHLPVQTGSCKC